MIELDRRGKNDCVFYDCYCPDFIEYVEQFGFEENDFVVGFSGDAF